MRYRVNSPGGILIRDIDFAKCIISAKLIPAILVQQHQLATVFARRDKVNIEM